MEISNNKFVNSNYVEKKEPESIKECIISINDFIIYVIIINENKRVSKEILSD